MRNQVSLAALCVALALACPARATVTSTASSTSYTCTGSVTAYTIPFPYLAASQIVATQTDAAGVATTVIGTVKPSIAPTSGTLTLPSACPSGSTLTISRSVALTQPQSFRTGSYSGAAHEQAFDRLTMETQQLDAKNTAQDAKDAAQDASRLSDLAAQATRDSGQDTAIAAAINPTPVTVSSNSLILATGSTTSRSLAARAADIVNVKDYGALGNGVNDDTAAITAAYNALTTGTVLLPSGFYPATSVPLKTKLTYQGQGVESTTLGMGTTLGTLITSASGGSYMGLSRMTVRGTLGLVGQTLFNVTNVFASYFNQVYFSSAENLVRLSSVEGQTIFRDCYFTGAGANGYGLRLDNVSDITILNSPFENSAHGAYATRTNAVIHLKFQDIHSENVGQLFNIDTNSGNGMVSFKDIVALNVGSNLADATTGYAFRVNNEYAIFDDIAVTTVNANTPVITTPSWSIYARDCPSFTAADSTTCYIPHFEIGFGNSYIPNSKRSLLDSTETMATLYTVANGAAVTTTGGYGAFTGLGQYRIQPLTGPTLSPTPITNKAIMVRFEYRSTTAGTYTINGGVGGQMIGYSGSTVVRSGNTIQLPSTAGVWTRVYFYARYTGEFAPGSVFFYINSTATTDTMDIRAFDIFEVNRPPYSLLDW